MFRSWLVIVLASLGMLEPARALAQTAAPGAADGPPSRVTSGKAQNTPKPPSPAPGQLSDEAELARIAGLYEAAKYRECSAEIERLLDPTAHRTLRQTGVVENARVYWAACLLGAGEGDAADAPLRAAIHENPQMKPPDSLVFPQPVVERFLKVRDSLVNEIRAAEQARIVQAQREAQRRVQSRARELDRMRELEKLAAKETLSQRNSRAVAAIPFGVGQFQNREPALGYTFLISEALLGGLSFTAVVLQSKLATEASRLQRGGQAVDDAQQESNQRTLGALKTGGFWAFAALAIGGIVQAQVAYVPEFREERPRKLPPSLSPTTSTPEVSAIPFLDKTGGGLNVVGRF